MRKLEGADFEVAASWREGELQPSEWWVGRYEFEGEAIVEVSTSATQWRRYSPFTEASNLFFSFARLYETEDFADSALQWVKRYGFPTEFYYGNVPFRPSLSSILASRYSVDLAVEEEKQLEDIESHSRTRWMPAPAAYWEETREDPPSVDIEQLRAESHKAWNTLAHYEASINQEPQRVLYLPNGEVNPTYQELMEPPNHLIATSLHERSSMPRDVENMDDLSSLWSERKNAVMNSVMSIARKYAERQVTYNVNEHCYLQPLGEEHRKESKSKWVWNFKDLYGAMYLQMMWVMERGIRVNRCKACLRAFPNKGPKGQKSPDRKMFCGPACGVAYRRARERSQ